MKNPIFVIGMLMLILWIAGWVTAYTFSGAIHLLFIVALMLMAYSFYSQRKSSRSS